MPIENHRSVLSLIDPANTHSVISRVAAIDLGYMKYKQEDNLPKCQKFSGEESQVLGVLDLNTTVDKKPVPIKFIVVRKINAMWDCILGSDFLSKSGIIDNLPDKIRSRVDEVNTKIHT